MIHHPVTRCHCYLSPSTPTTILRIRVKGEVKDAQKAVMGSVQDGNPVANCSSAKMVLGFITSSIHEDNRLAQERKLSRRVLLIIARYETRTVIQVHVLQLKLIFTGSDLRQREREHRFKIYQQFSQGTHAQFPC